MVTPLMTRAVNRWQRSGASMRTRARPRAASPASFSATWGGRRRAAHHRVVVTARAHPAEEQRIAAVALAELALDGFDLADDHALEVGGQRRDGRDLDARVDETLGGLSSRQPEIDELAHPRVRD